MPLFEPQERRTKRLFEEVYRYLLTCLLSTPLDAGLVPVVQKLTCAGSVAAGVSLLQGLKSFWPSHEPDSPLRVKVMMVTEVFTLAMVSRFMAGSPEFDGYDAVQDEFIEFMLHLFADHPDPDSLEYFLAVNRQFQADLRRGNPYGHRTLCLGDVLYMNEAVNRLGGNRPRYPVAELPLTGQLTMSGLINRGVRFFNFDTQQWLLMMLDSTFRDNFPPPPV